MAYNVTDQEKQKAAARDTAIKLKREAIIAASLLGAYFLPLARNFKKSYAQTGAIPNLTQHDQDLVKVLNRNYRGTSNKFIRQVREGLGTPVNALELNKQIKADSALMQILDIHFSSQSIANTTQNNLNKIVNDIIIGAATVGATLTNKQVANQATSKFISDSKGRLPVISVTQTQQAGEGAKYTELNTLIRNNAVFPKSDINLGTAKVEKTWIAILDGRTRAAHVAADLQTVDFNGVYNVGGEQLRIPGDTSLGATPGNIIGCRCDSVKSIRKA